MAKAGKLKVPVQKVDCEFKVGDYLHFNGVMFVRRSFLADAERALRRAHTEEAEEVNRREAAKPGMTFSYERGKAYAYHEAANVLKAVLDKLPQPTDDFELPPLEAKPPIEAPLRLGRLAQILTAQAGAPRQK